VAWTFLKAHFDELARRMRGDEATWLLSAMVSSFCDEGRRRKAAAFFEPRAPGIEGVPLALRNALERVDACVDKSQRNAAGIEAFPRSY
jgi:hypothetical protein